MKNILLKIFDAFRIYGLPILAIVGFMTAVSVVRAGNKPPSAVAPVSEPSHSTFEYFVAGAGIVEAKNENVSIATEISGVVEKIFVEVGQQVNQNDPLFRISSKSQQSLVYTKESALLVAAAKREAAKADFDFISSLKDKRAVSEEEFVKRLNDLNIAKATELQAKQELEQAKVDLDRLTVKAPRNGSILSIKVRVGEFATAQNLSTPLIVLGDTSSYWLRVDVDENDAWRLIKEGSKSVATLRGNSNLKTELKFVHFEPYVIPKKSLTGDNSERVDTRVLQVIFEFQKPDWNIYVGQLMDVYIEAKPHE